MATPFIGQITPFGFTFPPLDWAQCNGQPMPISQYQALFAVIGTNFGGNGQSTFNLPDLMNNAVMGSGQGPGLTNRSIGQQVGEMQVTLTVNQMPSHLHTLFAGNSTNTGQYIGMPGATAQIGPTNDGKPFTTTTTPLVAFSPKAIGVTGQSTGHNNVQPLNTFNICIALQGLFPARN